MKMMTILATLVFAAIAQATPAVGDYSKFNLTISNGQQSAAGSYEVAIVGMDGEAYKVSTTTTFPDQPAQYNEESVTADQLAADSDIAAVLSNCAQYGGQLQNTTVPAGTFNTCSLPTQSGGRIWLGQVPFGIVKQTDKTQEGHDVTLELQMFIVGK